MADSDPASYTAPSRLGIGFNVLLQVILGVAICIGVNYLSYQYYVREDLSPSGSFSLSSATENFLRKLAKEVEIIVLIPRGSKLYEDVHSLADEYVRNGKKLVKVEFVDPTRDVERAEQIKIENNMKLQTTGLLIKANKNTRFIREEELVVLTPGSDKDNPSVDFRCEDAITSAIIGLIESVKRKFYLVIGKGSRTEAGTGEVLAALKELGRQQNYDVLPLNLGEVSAIPSDASGVFFIGAKYDVSERELGQLKTYWSQKSAGLMMLLDPSAETPRLDGFLKSLGVTPRGDRVLFAESTAAGPRKEFGVQASFSKESPITRPVRDSTTRLEGQTQSLALAEAEALKPLGLTVTPLVTASPRYWGESSYLDDLPVIGEGDTPPPVHVAAAIERGAVQDESVRVDSARLMVAGNASLLDPQTRMAENQDFLAAAINWMLHREKLIGITPKAKRAYRIQLSDHQRSLLFWITAFCAPAVVLAFGFSVWAKRRSI